MSLGPRLKRALVASVTGLALLPAGALAQGAGDDQYSDPFGEEQAAPTATPRAPAATPTAAPAQSAPTAAPPSQPGPAATPTPTSPTLPYTGFDEWLVAGGGVLVLGAGLTLRARLREPD